VVAVVGPTLLRTLVAQEEVAVVLLKQVMLVAPVLRDKVILVVEICMLLAAAVAARVSLALLAMVQVLIQMEHQALLVV
tara:strand:- start:314 stop:550 length:237 start_codon:yes stop_codon:yes gene_type:complete